MYKLCRLRPNDHMGLSTVSHYLLQICTAKSTILCDSCPHVPIQIGVTIQFLHHVLFEIHPLRSSIHRDIRLASSIGNWATAFIIRPLPLGLSSTGYGHQVLHSVSSIGPNSRDAHASISPYSHLRMLGPSLLWCLKSDYWAFQTLDYKFYRRSSLIRWSIWIVASYVLVFLFPLW